MLSLAHSEVYREGKKRKKETAELSLSQPFTLRKNNLERKRRDRDLDIKMQEKEKNEGRSNGKENVKKEETRMENA